MKQSSISLIQETQTLPLLNEATFENLKILLSVL